MAAFQRNDLSFWGKAKTKRPVQDSKECLSSAVLSGHLAGGSARTIARSAAAGGRHAGGLRGRELRVAGRAHAQQRGNLAMVSRVVEATAHDWLMGGSWQSAGAKQIANLRKQGSAMPSAAV